MPEVDPTMGEPEKPPSRLEQIKYYTSLFLGALAIVCVFGFLFLVPFVLDPAISTIMHQFVTEPVHCNVSQHSTATGGLISTILLINHYCLSVKVSSYELRYGKSNCTWASCKEGCTAEIFKCHQIRVNYTPLVSFTDNVQWDSIPQEDWAHLTR